MGLISGAAIHPPRMAILARKPAVVYLQGDWHLPGAFVLLTVLCVCGARACARLRFGSKPRGRKLFSISSVVTSCALAFPPAGAQPL